ncbi:MAG: hypothetical protein AVDCRST_MAG19-1850 [uncultured Thermomicrobiales bacterium]|uniref:Uncharacterized protein n=1 Tax=uncultured Thermomicrobiales bacterium TaxID=1645740 RepID=A0A6J4UV60_9BACT|nr:MAG: hypothetical protein AVDCRST_MAG19-1850 [uncultured Thermomicrobiales bacterium]
MAMPEQTPGLGRSFMVEDGRNVTYYFVDDGSAADLLPPAVGAVDELWDAISWSVAR